MAVLTLYWEKKLFGGLQFFEGNTLIGNLNVNFWGSTFTCSMYNLTFEFRISGVFQKEMKIIDQGGNLIGTCAMNSKTQIISLSDGNNYEWERRNFQFKEWAVTELVNGMPLDMIASYRRVDSFFKFKGQIVVHNDEKNNALLITMAGYVLAAYFLRRRKKNSQ